MRGSVRAAAILTVAVLAATVSGAWAEGPKFTEFSGSSLCVDEGPPTPPWVRGSKLHITDYAEVCNDIASERRVTGAEHIVINAVLGLDGMMPGPMWGTSHIVVGDPASPLGEWEGVWTGERTDEGFAFIRMHAVGKGEFHGLQAWWDLQRLSPDAYAAFTFTGRILEAGK